MTTTTIRLPEDLKARIDRLAAARGSTVHGLMVQAIADAADQLERREAFHAEAERRFKKMLRTGEYLTHEDLRDYGMALARGEKPERPQVRKLEPEVLARMRASARRVG